VWPKYYRKEDVYYNNEQFNKNNEMLVSLSLGYRQHISFIAFLQKSTILTVYFLPFLKNGRSVIFHKL
jgi:hypothetical protein